LIPQGAADLQSAGFSHSPTRPSLGLPRFLSTTCVPQGLSNKPCTLKPGGTQTRVPKSFCFSTYATNRRKRKTDSCLKTPARSILTSGTAPPHSPAETCGGAGGGN